MYINLFVFYAAAPHATHIVKTSESYASVSHTAVATLAPLLGGFSGSNALPLCFLFLSRRRKNIGIYSWSFLPLVVKKCKTRRYRYTTVKKHLSPQLRTVPSPIRVKYLHEHKHFFSYFTSTLTDITSTSALPVSYILRITTYRSYVF